MFFHPEQNTYLKQHPSASPLKPWPQPDWLGPSHSFEIIPNPIQQIYSAVKFVYFFQPRPFELLANDPYIFFQNRNQKRYSFGNSQINSAPCCTSGFSQMNSA